MAKVTLPNGVVIEADTVKVAEDGTVTLQDIKTESDRKETSPPRETRNKVQEAINGLSRKQWETYMALKEMGGVVSLTALANALEIENPTASQRARWLIEQGLAERVETAKFRAILP